MENERALKERLPQIKEAEEVTIELDDSYWTKTPTKRYVIQENCSPNCEGILSTLARKLKYHHLLWCPVEVGDVGVISNQFLKDIVEAFPHNIKFKVIDTKPKVEVQITPNTKIVLKFSEIMK